MVITLVPLTLALILASTAVANQLSSRHQAVAVRQSSLVLDSLLRARIDVYAEYVPSQAIVTARTYGVTPAGLNTLLGVDVQKELVDARRTVDGQAVFRPGGPFHHGLVQLEGLRRSIDRATATPAQLTAAFNGLDATIEDSWQDTFAHEAGAGNLPETPATRQRLDVLGSSFSAFTAGVGEENLPGGGSLESLLTATATPGQVQSLISSRQQFEDASRSFPGSLGPKATVAWAALSNGALTRQFSDYVQTAIVAGLNHLPPPVATSSAGIGGVARSEVAWAGALAHLVLASSADLRSASAQQAHSATDALVITVVLMALVILLVLAAMVFVGRQVRRPLDGIVAAATSVREGELDFPPLDESGPKELALAAAAINEMASTLRAVQAQAGALSGGDLDDPVLRRQLPGRTGAALQSALNQLHESVQTSESEREALFQQATRDSLTGLLNRGAALEALEIDLATAHRSHGELLLTLFYIDLDDLKSINDSIGHDGGDAAIRAVADALKLTTRASDVIARFGGDEFVVGWLGSRESHVPTMLATRIGARVAHSQVGDRAHPTPLACSIGVAVSEPSDTTVLTLIERADRALYDAKAHGKGQARWFHHADLADSPADISS
jgi:diguanylate cyclase (GGDEF)-like protein